ncbi:hypothetical protein DPMN_020639 [Dreissena polymorpha]|uniref:Uncharacterized protein n=1 Tax=Dreissena polymorpha TaxID=45954 RepID=A0A9D4SB76_DREPO|nr:hypothetical protein DPMN_001740 [Dreissena polymorpha]KAH3896462.1 hypothetical protein DPMN_020639 [Dreissena polymorpha]
MAVVPESGRVQFEEDMEVVGRWCGLRVGVPRNAKPSALDCHFHWSHTLSNRSCGPSGLVHRQGGN